MIDPKQLMRQHSTDELNKAAEEYFAKVHDYTYLLRKPFTAPDECSKLLLLFAALVQGLKAHRGMDVLDFGARSCWTSHFFSQMGCKVHPVNVSPTALEIGRDRYAQHPPFGGQPQPDFVVYDGRRLPFPDASMDRVSCFDALHHVPNADELLREMSRVLKPDGIAGFSEPGPEHSKTPLSQLEMGNHGVLENDVVIEDIWRCAQISGFKQIELSVPALRPTRLPLADYTRFLARPSRFSFSSENDFRVLDPMREDAALNRLFFLYKEDRRNSRSGGPLTAELQVTLPKGSAYASGQPIPIVASVRNNTGCYWLPGPEPIGGVNLACHVLNIKSNELRSDDFRFPLKPERGIVEPGERVLLHAEISGLSPGEFEVEFDLVSEQVCWFAENGSNTCRFKLVVG